MCHYEEQDILNDYATRSLRFTADQDYISARNSYRAKLIEPFLWSSLHAIEKYLKAILLFHAIPKPRKPYGHNIDKILNTVKDRVNFDLRLPEESESFINYINYFGKNRYFEDLVCLEEYALYNLDQTVWYVRRYCYNMKAYEGVNGRQIKPEEQEKNPKNSRNGVGG